MTAPADRATRFVASEQFARECYESWLAPGFGKPCEPSAPVSEPGSDGVVLAARIRMGIDEPARDVLVFVDAALRLTTLPTVPGVDREVSARFAPSGWPLATVGIGEDGVGQVLLRDAPDDEPRGLPTVPGTVEELCWSPDGGRLALRVAALGASRPGALGSGKVAVTSGAESWRPQVVEGIDDQWRSVWVGDSATGFAQISPAGATVWEMSWLDDDRLLVLVSEDPGESGWYVADLRILGTDGALTPLYAPDPRRQLHAAVSSPSGTHVAVIESRSSDRGMVAGDVLLLALGDSLHPPSALRLDLGFDASDLAWTPDGRLLIAGLAGTTSLIASWTSTHGVVREWETSSTWDDVAPTIALTCDGSALVVETSFTTAHRLIRVRGGQAHVLVDFAHEGSRRAVAATAGDTTQEWAAPDARVIQGILCLPRGEGPFPLVIQVHGGPVWAARSEWDMLGHPYTRVLVAAGYAVLHPNPRGSFGRGQDHIDALFIDPGFADEGDFRAAIDHLVAQGVADPDRIAVVGLSYGGLTAAWLATRWHDLGAAVALSPVTDWVSQHWTSNIPWFDEHYLDADPRDRTGRYVTHSPLTHTVGMSTPTLLMAGSLDDCTPPSQATEFYNAARDAGVPTALVIYPEEGHGVADFPALLDYTARILDWLVRHVPPDGWSPDHHHEPRRAS